jgi:hypothetical protein
MGLLAAGIPTQSARANFCSQIAGPAESNYLPTDFRDSAIWLTLGLRAIRLFRSPGFRPSVLTLQFFAFAERCADAKRRRLATF